MGNCVLKGGSDKECSNKMIKVMTHSGGVMELYTPITAECVVNSFPGHGIFKTSNSNSNSNAFSSQPPLLHNEELRRGQIYHIRPLHNTHSYGAPSVAAPYRMSFGHNGYFWKRPDVESFPRSNSGGSGNKNGNMWKVKLVISPTQLTEILSQESRTEELIESVRTVALCDGSVSSMTNFDQLSRGSSSWKAYSENMAI